MCCVSTRFKNIKTIADDKKKGHLKVAQLCSKVRVDQQAAFGTNIRSISPWASGEHSRMKVDQIQQTNIPGVELGVILEVHVVLEVASGLRVSR